MGTIVDIERQWFMSKSEETDRHLFCFLKIFSIFKTFHTFYRNLNFSSDHCTWAHDVLADG